MSADVLRGGGASLLVTLVHNHPAADYWCVLQVYEHMLKRYALLEGRVLQEMNP